MYVVRCPASSRSVALSKGGSSLTLSMTEGKTASLTLAKDGGFTTECDNRNGNARNHLFGNHRGYVLCTVTPDRWEAAYRVLPTVKDPDATASTLTSFVVEYGHPGAQLAGDCVNAAPG